MVRTKLRVCLMTILGFMLLACGCTSTQQPLPVYEEQAETEAENDIEPADETVSENAEPEPTVEPEPVLYLDGGKNWLVEDRKYDAELAALDTERNAVKSEMETLKTVARENVERTFKLFS